jgi:cytochrome c peroxidase
VMRVIHQSLFTGLLLLWAGAASSQGVPRYSSQIELGRALFEDKNLSADRSVACASCHAEAHAFADSRAVSVGNRGRSGTRNAPSLLDLNLYSSYFWDGRVKTLEEQMTFPLSSPSEMGLSNSMDVIARVRESPGYLYAFNTLLGVPPAALNISNVISAISMYERSLKTEPNSLDDYLSGNKSALSTEAREGMQVFQGAAECGSCHRLSMQAAPLTDNDYHSSGIGMHTIAPKLATLVQRLVSLAATQRFQAAQTDPDVAALGRFLVTLDPQDIGKFRTPSLRNVARTAPYMHDGSVGSLETAVEIELYYRGRDLGHPIVLSDIEKQALLTFLRALSAPERLSATTSSLQILP